MTGKDYDAGRWRGEMDQRMKSVEADLAIIKKFFYGLSIGVLAILGLQILGLIGVGQ